MATVFKTTRVLSKDDVSIGGQVLSVIVELACPIYTDQKQDGTPKIRQGHESKFIVIRRNGRELRFGFDEAAAVTHMLTSRLGSSTPA